MKLYRPDLFRPLKIRQIIRSFAHDIDGLEVTNILDEKNSLHHI